MVTRNPWQRLKDEAAKIRTPTQVLQEQAGLLQDATAGVLRGRVSTKDVGEGRARITLSVYVPTLNNYAVELLRVSHPLVQYPAVLFSEWIRRRVQCSNHEDLETAVTECLENPKVQQLVVGLFAQTQQAASPQDPGAGPGEGG